MDKRDIVDTVALRKAQYCRHLDTKRWDEFAALFHETPELTFLGPEGETTASFSTTSEFVALTRSFLDGAQSIHQIHNAEIVVVSDHEVAAIWSMEDYIIFPAGHEHHLRSMHGYGHYHETWKRQRGDWVITRLELRRTIFELQHQDSQA
ncbi:hypothetical protein FHT86_006621 [Rhizobium sp. BK313]|uniref:nuclear transport factor 2 family protein n=1 Tax=Rhizobium sp. BK313 TaxID=2587081 RepID=UPI00105EE398|nr:nuclear transport factor 2 family protein [Rhizobium sp. BK313]MBB3458296.1 hypothetical protein [Rhizobium sp. BK313]